ncbi:MAG: hypothetical protein DRQ24_10960 [Candidatus Latescibacterota bacterium]|nr:MAG: hypothetical protein DRQ24_10960 [Candidatus Latescibacterota bacterium]
MLTKMSEYTTVKFSDSYGLADSIWKILFETSQSDVDHMFEIYFYPCCEHRAYQLAKPNRWTLLHRFIHCYYWDSYEAFEHYRDDMRDLIITEYEAVLNFYEIPYPRFDIPEEMSEDYDRKTAEAICSLRSLLPSVRIVHDTFQLLFGDRASLMKFNQGIARVVRDHLKKQDYPEIVESDGVLCRVYLPIWVKRAVFYRDKGRCVVCGKDLTGTILTGEEVHYDHMVPLAEGGANDPTNFQLMCRNCNLSKAQKTGTSDKYQTYWNLDDKSLIEARRYFEGRVGSPVWLGCVQENDEAA